MSAAEELLRDLVLTQDGFGWGYMYALLMLQSGLVDEARKFFDLHVEVFLYEPSGLAAGAFARGIQGDLAGMLELADEILAVETDDTLNHLLPVLWVLPRSNRVEQTAELRDRLRAMTTEPSSDPAAPLLLAYLESQIAYSNGDRTTGLVIAEAMADRGLSAWAAIAYMIWDDSRADFQFALASQPPFPTRRDMHATCTQHANAPSLYPTRISGRRQGYRLAECSWFHPGVAA